ncbi:MAG: hypothetical protein LBI39_01400 [Puniceicoccales bacterium]|jgi:hypothetical protein|nr:hypothetical protein [Puniceicoccales bacterium]
MVANSIFWEPSALGQKFNVEKFFRDAEALHLTFEEALAYSEAEDGDVRKRTDDFVAYESEFEESIDRITSNVVGRTLFRLIVAKARMRRGGEKMRLVSYGGSVNRYELKEFAVKINLNMFDEDGIGVNERQYYYADKNGDIVPKRKTLDGTIFHEFCHALHDISRSGEIADGNQLSGTNEILACSWGNDEELRTIAGCTLGQRYDPICDHCYELCICMDRNQTFFPRYSHEGYDAAAGESDEAAKRKRMRAHFFESQVIMGGWRSYVL